MAGGNKGGNLQAKLKGDIISLPVAASTKIFRGTNVAIDTTGGLVQLSDATGLRYAGVAEETIDNTSGALAALACRVRRRGIFRMKKASVNVATDIGKVVAGKVAQTASVDETVDLLAACTYDIAIGTVVRVEAIIGTSQYIWVDIQATNAALLQASDISTHAGLTDQSAHTADGIAPVVKTVSGATVTLTGAEFMGGTVNVTYDSGSCAITLPTSGVTTAGTLCRIINAHATPFIFTVTGGTLTGPSVASNIFTGCGNEGDSMVVEYVSTNVFRVVDVSQTRTKVNTSSSATPAPTAGVIAGGIYTVSNAAPVVTMPATQVIIGQRVIIEHITSAGLLTITAGTLIGPQCTGNSFYGCYGVGDSVELMNVAADSWVVLRVTNRRTQIAKTATGNLSAAEVMSFPHITIDTTGGAVALTVPAAGATNVGASVLISNINDTAGATVVCAAGFGGDTTNNDVITLLRGDAALLYSDGTQWVAVNSTTAA